MKDRLKTSFTHKGKRYWVYGHTQKELMDNYAQKKKEVENSVPTSNMKVRDWALYCFEHYKVNLREVTKAKYLRKMNHCLIDPIGHLRLQDVRPIDCQEVLNLLKGKSKAYINEIYQMLRFVFGKAYDNDLIEKDPTRDLVRPKGTKVIRRAITEKERAALYKAAQDNPRLLPFIVMLECGLRPGEALDLKTTDIIYMDNIPVISVRGTKTDNAVRKVPISPELLERISKAKINDLNDYFFTMKNGKRHDEKSYQRLTKALYRAMDIELGATTYRNRIVESVLDIDFCPYCLRKTYCTDLAKRGIDIRIAQKLMGHSTVELTANIYTVLDDEYVVKTTSVVKPVVKIAESLDTTA